MKILLATGGSGGPVTYGEILEKELPKYSISVEVVNFKSVFKYPPLIRHVFYLILLLRKQSDVDVIYALDAATVGLPAWVASVLLRKRFYIRIPGDWVWEQGVQRWGIEETLDEYLQKKNYSSIVKILRWGQTFITKRAQKVVVPSIYLKNVLIQWGITPSKIFVIYNSFEETHTITQKVERKKHRIISIGRLVPWKGFTLLTECILDLRSTFPEISLVILGDGPEKNKLLDQIKKNNLEKKITLLGEVNKDKVQEELSQSEIFVLNTGYEGFSHTLLEVMNSGTPVITTDVGGNSEIVENGVNGILVPYNDKRAVQEAILKLFNDIQTSSLYAEKGRIKVKDFSRERMIQATIEVFI